MNETRGTILVVDDDPDFSESVTTFLRVQGYEVLQARDGGRGLALARQHVPDLILMDIMMRERTEGLFTVQQIRRDPALMRIPVFVVSSLYADAPGFRIRPEQGWMGHDEFFPKPVDLDRLLASVEEHLANRVPLGGEARR